MQAQRTQSVQQEMLRRRMPLVAAGLVVISVLLMLRLMGFQFLQDPRVASQFAAQRDANIGRTERFESSRGNIYDRDGEPMAVNSRQYRIGISPNLVSNAEQTANQLAAILNRDPLDMYNLIRSNVPWVSLGTVDPETWRQIDALGLFAIRVERVQRRLYPQGALASQLLGFVAGVGEDARGYNGVEGYYQGILAGRVRDQEVSTIPFGLPEDVTTLRPGADLVLTIDRDIQFLAEMELQRSIAETGATGGTILIMNPRNGDILAMTSYPSFDPNAYFEVTNQEVLNNPAISDVFEPGSVFKVITVAAALEMGTITPNWTYNDQASIDIGGIRIENWDRRAHGLVDVTGVLVNSLNVGVATISTQMGWENFYRMLDRFGIGRRTQVDLQGEVEGLLRVPGDSLWSESDLGTNSFGQGVAVTPLQMLTAVNAIANGGLMMQPRVVYQYIDGEDVHQSRESAVRRPISPETARIVTEMMVATVRDGLDEAAQLPGYTVAGKTGTAEIPSALAYESGAYIMSFVGFLPADDPQVSILIKLDRPTSGRWASQVVAPIFRRLAERLVVLMQIPNDQIRAALTQQAAQGTTSP